MQNCTYCKDFKHISRLDDLERRRMEDRGCSRCRREMNEDNVRGRKKKEEEEETRMNRELRRTKEK